MHALTLVLFNAGNFSPGFWPPRICKVLVAVVGGLLATIQSKTIKNTLTRVHLFWSRGHHTNSINTGLKRLLSLKIDFDWGWHGVVVRFLWIWDDDGKSISWVNRSKDCVRCSTPVMYNLSRTWMTIFKVHVSCWIWMLSGVGGKHP